MNIEIYVKTERELCAAQNAATAANCKWEYRRAGIGHRVQITGNPAQIVAARSILTLAEYTGSNINDIVAYVREFVDNDDTAAMLDDAYWQHMDEDEPHDIKIIGGLLESIAAGMGLRE